MEKYTTLRIEAGRLTIFPFYIVKLTHFSKQRELRVRDLRSYARQTNTRLVIGGLCLLFVVGLGLIYVFYGSRAALLGFLCLVLGLAPLVLIWLALLTVEWVTKRADR
jgi:hypothetical protein